jgi:hypothetical protein
LGSNNRFNSKTPKILSNKKDKTILDSAKEKITPIQVSAVLRILEASIISSPKMPKIKEASSSSRILVDLVTLDNNHKNKLSSSNNKTLEILMTLPFEIK